MKHLIKTLVLGAAVVLAAPLAHATPISGSIGFGGNGSYDPSQHVFTAGPVIGSVGADAYVNSPSAPGTSLAIFGMFNPATFFTFNAANAASTAGGVPVFTTTVGGVTLTFNLTNLLSDGTTPSSQGVQGGSGLVGVGTLSETGYTSTMGTFALNTTTGAATFTTFSTAAAATPEPSSLILLGSGLVSAAGMLVRRRRIA